jgi:hypothetical protein
MTKQEFLAGNPFSIGLKYRKGDSTYYFTPSEITSGSLSKQIRSGVDGRIITDDYHLSVDKIGTKSFTGFVFVMEKRVNIKYRFEDLKSYVEEIVEV